MSASPENFIAIVGMSCRFAGCEDLKDFWLRVLTGTPAISGSPDKSADRYLLEEPSSFRHVTTLNAGYLKDLWQVRGTSLPFPQGALAGTNPELSLASELAAMAFKDAGAIGSAVPHDRVGAVIGYSPAIDPAMAGWCQHGVVVDQTMELIRRCFPHGTPAEFESLRKDLVASLPEYDSRNVAGLFRQAIATVIADRCDISGPVFCVDRGAISSQLAIQAACDALRLGRADLVLAGGVQGLVTPPLLMPYSRLGLLSKSGAIHPFGQDADGTLLGEGGGFLALKRHSDALRGGDRVYAIVRACDAASDGNAKRAEGGLSAALRRAWGELPFGIDTIDLLEANGTGVPATDRAELKATASLLGASSALPPESIALGSAKALIGHCGAASGIASAIKAALSLYHRIIPPAQEAGRAAEALRLPETPFYLNPRPRPWIHNDAGPARRAGITSLAFGGAAAHLVLEQASP